MSAPKIIRGTIPGLLPGTARVEVPVIGVLIDQRVDMQIGFERVLALEVGTGDAVPQMAVDGIDEEELAKLAPIVATRVGCLR